MFVKKVRMLFRNSTKPVYFVFICFLVLLVNIFFLHLNNQCSENGRIYEPMTQNLGAFLEVYSKAYILEHNGSNVIFIPDSSLQEKVIVFNEYISAAIQDNFDLPTKAHHTLTCGIIREQFQSNARFSTVRGYFPVDLDKLKETEKVC